MPKYVFKMVWHFEAFDDAEARHMCKRDLLHQMDILEDLAADANLEDLTDNILNPYRMALNKAGSDENILKRGDIGIRAEKEDA